MITREILKSKGPCTSGYVEVLEKYGNNFSVSYDQILLDFPKFREWIERNLYSYRNMVDKDYNGKFKLGQVVYRQMYGIGSYEKTKIHEIQKNRSGEGFYFRVEVKNTNDFNIVQANDLFDTLDDLKAYWVEKIKSIKDSELVK